MKKLFYYVRIVIAALALMFFVGAFVPQPVSSQTTASQVPANVQSALDQALLDPPLNPEFLWDVGQDLKVRELMNFAPIVVVLDRLTIYYSIETDVQVVLEKSCGTMLTRGDIVRLGCEDGEDRSCCAEMQMIMMDHRQSDFWAAFSNAIQTGKK